MGVPEDCGRSPRGSDCGEGVAVAPQESDDRDHVTLEQQVEALGLEIRGDKARLKEENPKITNAEINQILGPKIERMKHLKTMLSDDSKFSQATFERAKAQEQKLLEERKRAEVAASKQRRDAKLAQLRNAKEGVPKVQRKIFHMFSYTGNGPDFRYFDPVSENDKFGLNGEVFFGATTDQPCSSDAASSSSASASAPSGSAPGPTASLSFDLSSPLFFTQKWDGSTMQATNSAVFRRIDRKGSDRVKGGDRVKGSDRTKSRSSKQESDDGRDHDPASAEDEFARSRYDLVLLAWWDESGGAWTGVRDADQTQTVYAECVEGWLDRFRAIPAGMCVYFEAVHSGINARYKHLGAVQRHGAAQGGAGQQPFEPGIRVFDVGVLSSLSMERISAICRDHHSEECSAEELIASLGRGERQEQGADGLVLVESSPETGFPSYKFLPNCDSIARICAHFGLPYVGFNHRVKRLDPPWTAVQAYEVLREIATDDGKHRDDQSFVDAPLEGLVMRQDGGQVAKARVECIRE